MIRLSFFLLFVCAGVQLSFGQHRTVQHYVFSTDSIEELEIVLPDSVDIRFWPGNTVLVEQHIFMGHASKSLFAHFLEKTDRYRIEGEREGDLLRVAPVVMVREPLKDKDGFLIEEEVRYVVYMSDVFEPFAANRWRRKARPE